MEKPSVTVIVLNWNGKDLTVECLESLQQVNYSNFNILVVDNGSTDGSVELLKEKFPEVSILVLEKNLGYAGGNNRGFDSLKPDQPEYVIFLNNDTIVDENFIGPLVKQLLTHKKASQTVPKIYYENDPKLIWYAAVLLIYGQGRYITWGFVNMMVQPTVKHIKQNMRLAVVFACVMRNLKSLVGLMKSFPCIRRMWTFPYG